LKIPRAEMALLILLLVGHFGLPASVLAASIEISSREVANLGITVVRPQRTGRLKTVDAMASVVVPPQSDLAVAALQTGVVTRLYVSAGESVVQGQPLAGILSREFLNLQSDYLDALGMQALAENTRKRDEQLHVEGIVSQRRLNESRTRAAEADLHLAEQRHLLALNGLTGPEMRELEESRELLELVTIRAPISGEVLRRWVGAGDQVNPGEPLFRIADLAQLWLELQLPAEALADIAPGFIVTRNLPGSEQALARVTAATRVVDPQSQKVMVRAETTNANHQLLPGQRIEVRIHIEGSTADGNTSWEVPSRTIVRDGDQSYLFVRNASGFEVVEAVVHGGTGELAFVEAAIDERTQIALTGVAALKAIWLSAES